MSTETRNLPDVRQTRAGSGLADSGATEYRGVSVLMADLVASTDHMEALGAEGYADLLRRFHTICNDAVRARGGTVAQYQGDGIICYFGFPSAREDDAVRAVEAALDIVDALSRAEQEGALETRIGISSGTVMLRSDGDQFGANAVGRCINRAARLEAMADANTVLICADTQRLIGTMFQIRDLGAQKLKGFRESQPVHAVIRGRNGVTTRFEALRGRQSTALVGRDAELAQLRNWLARARGGQGTSAVISAEAGFGKSRLLSALLNDPVMDGAPCFLLQCSPEHVGTPLYPVVRYLEWVAGTGPHEGDATRHARIKRLVTHVWGATEPETDILLDLLSPLGAEGEIDHSESPPLRRQRALTLLTDNILASVAGRGAFVIAFEDVHWIDPTSAVLLDTLVARLRDHPALLLMTTRPEPPYGAGAQGAELLHLRPLDKTASIALVRQALGNTGVDAGQIDRIIEKSDGVPLFVQEYADMLRQSGHLVADADVPLTLAGLVQSKLDRLDPATRLFAQAGAALGRVFDPILVSDILGEPHADAQSRTRALAGLRLIQDGSQGAPGESLAFNHALIRDAIYAGMPGDRRRMMHNAIAETFLSQEPEISVADHVLAQHLARAGRRHEAGQRYLRAGQSEAMKGAAAEAMAHLDAGLAIVTALPESPERDLLELQLCAVRGPTLMVTRGPGSPDFGTCQARAMDLVERLDMHAKMVPVIFNTAEHAWAVADLDRAQIMADAIAMIDHQSPSDAAHMASNLLTGMVSWHRGENATSAGAFDRVIDRYDTDKHTVLYMQFIKDFGVFSHFYNGLAHTIMGDFDRGRDLAEGAIAISERIKFPHERGFALLARFNTAMLRGDVETAFDASAEARDFSITQGFPEFVAMAVFVQGWCAAERGDVETGVALMEDGFATWRSTGFSCWQALFAAILAPRLIQLGRMEDARTMLAHYIRHVDETGENQHRAPLLLARAILHVATGNGPAARDDITRARAVAEQQGARLWLDWINTRFPV